MAVHIRPPGRIRVHKRSKGERPLLKNSGYKVIVKVLIIIIPKNE
jgi:hypothetical protein